jgi:hypothetical protein
MALKNLEEAIVDRIRRALAKEMRRLRRESQRHATNGRATTHVLTRRGEVNGGGARDERHAGT